MDCAKHSTTLPNTNKSEKWLYKFNLDKIFGKLLVCLKIYFKSTERKGKKWIKLTMGNEFIKLNIEAY